MGNELAHWEDLLTAYGYCLRPERLQEEHLYHAIFQPAFHQPCFLSLYITFPGVESILTFGYLTNNCKWERNKELHSQRKETVTFAKPGDEESVYLRDVQMIDVPLEALQHFEQQMHEVHLLAPGNSQLTGRGRDGMGARGIVTDKNGTHHFDIWTMEELAEQQSAFSPY